MCEGWNLAGFSGDWEEMCEGSSNLFFFFFSFFLGGGVRRGLEYHFLENLFGFSFLISGLHHKTLPLVLLLVVSFSCFTFLPGSWEDVSAGEFSLTGSWVDHPPFFRAVPGYVSQLFAKPAVRSPALYDDHHLPAFVNYGVKEFLEPLPLQADEEEIVSVFNARAVFDRVDLFNPPV